MGLFSQDEDCSWDEYYALKDEYDEALSLLDEIVKICKKQKNKEVLKLINSTIDRYLPKPKISIKDEQKVIDWLDSEDFKNLVEPYKKIAQGK